MTDRRRYVFARHGETLADIADRELPSGTADASQLLASWNLHLAFRRSPLDDPNQLLPTDIVYLEPPAP